MNKKINVAVIFGGQSGEHEVSLMSAASVINAMDQEKYNITLIGITKNGEWMHYKGPYEKIETGEWEEIAKKAILNKEHKMFSVLPLKGIPTQLKDEIDVVFPVLHGPFGEDGTIQGVLEMSHIPYVGAGVLASAVAMDKELSKQIFEKVGLKVGKYKAVLRSFFRKHESQVIKEIEEVFEYPMFIKPANLGSSVGISKAHHKEELIDAIKKACEYDRKVIIEAFINGREVECAVLGNDEPKASVAGEIIQCHEFYDYDAKYLDGETLKLEIPTNLPKSVSEKIRQMAIKAYKAIDGSGLSRIDFFVERETMQVYINEINTMPGFTKFSMYPLLWQNTGIPYQNLIDELIEFAFKRHNGE